ncbi:MAG: hypothetical protein R3E01_24340 [Pirellulaceae bacterium]|nr:hypothetical protein [Planctomycetales bacterium]
MAKPNEGLWSSSIVPMLAVGAMLLLVVGCARHLPPDVAADLPSAMQIRAGFATADGSGQASDSGGSGAEPTGWATLRGRFIFDGTPPSPAALSITRDNDICAPGGKPVYSQSLVVDPNSKGIKNCVIFLTSSLKPEEPWTHPSMQPGKTDEVLFDQKECVFLSHVLAMQSSQPLRIKNSDSVGHNTNLSAKANPKFDQTIPSGESLIYQPSAEEREPFPVKCAIHPWMEAWMIMRDNSYYCVSQDDGSFVIENLPAGIELEFRVWQEACKFPKTVSIDGAGESGGKGKLTITLQSGADETMNITLPSSVF